MKEADRIKEAYARRDRSGKAELYTLFNPSALFLFHQRERALLEALKEAGLDGLWDKRILEVGCGTGGVLRDFIRYGARPENCSGIDLLPDRIETARRLSTNIDFRCGDAESLPYGEGSFDIVLSFTVFSSVLDMAMRESLAGEMLRVLRPGGIVLYYDYHMDNPRNRDVRGVKRKDIEALFTGCDISLRRVTLAPPLARVLAPISTVLCEVLEALPVLRTHYLGVMRKP